MHVTEPGLAHYLHVLRRGLWIVALAVALAGGAAVYASSQQRALYQSSEDVFLNTQNPASILASVATPASDPVRAAATQADLARTPAVAEQALRLARLSNRSAQDLLSNSSVSPAANADILRFSVTDHLARIAQQLAEDYATAYTRYRHQLDTAAFAKARRGIEAQLAQLKAAGSEHSAVYANLFEKAQELRTVQVLQGSNALLVRTAGAAVQVQPRPVRNGVLAALLGLFLGLGAAFLREALSTRVRTAGEVQDQLAMPQLGRVPEPPRRLRGGNLVMLAAPLSPAAEPFRILATNLDLVNFERGARTIMFTSATRGEGKSTTVANLAVAFARAGRRVLLVDLDMRKPSLAELFALGDAGPGVTSVTLGHAQVGNVLVAIPLPESTQADGGSTRGASRGVLEVLPAGPLPPNPAEFVGSQALAALLAECEQRADLVLIDAPPILDLSDTVKLSARVDGLVVVTRLPFVKRSALRELHRVLRAAPSTKLGFVLTGTTAGESYGAYGYGVPGASQATWEPSA